MIDSLADLALRVGVHRDTFPMIAQSIEGGLAGYLRTYIPEEFGVMTLVGRGPSGKPERAGEAYRRITGKDIDKKPVKAAPKGAYKWRKG